MYRFTNINRTNRFTTIVRKHWFTRISSKILELPGLLELTARTILSEFRRHIGLQTSTGRTLLLKLTGHTGLLGSIERISTGYIHKVTRNNRKYKCTRTNRASRFIWTKSTYNFIEINRTSRFKSINRMYTFKWAKNCISRYVLSTQMCFIYSTPPVKRHYF